jgi:flagellar biosynthesis protein
MSWISAGYGDYTMDDNDRRKDNNDNNHSLELQSQANDTSQRAKTAVALFYDPEDQAPKVIASGKGYLADRIIERAKEADIPLHKDEKLANSLSKLEIGDAIPSELYEVVAEVLVFVDKMDRIKGKVLQ